MKRVLEIFREICAIPHGSGDMERISDYCVSFAKENGLWVYRDDARNVIVKKAGSKGYENSPAVILQGHLDMVCQKEETIAINFETDGITTEILGDELFAKGTTLGADNGIGVAMILAILERGDLFHPPLEAVFTVDEEIGLLGAGKLDFSLLRANKMINLDTENDDVITVSCAGGSTFSMQYPLSREKKTGTEIVISLCGLAGGHTGVEIHKGRVNANLLAGRFLNHMRAEEDFFLLSLSGGDKDNAIPRSVKIRLLSENAKSFCERAQRYFDVIQKEIRAREPDFSAAIEILSCGEKNVFSPKDTEQIITLLALLPDGVISMSREIENLVETSLNLGILRTEEDRVILSFGLRSNKASALSGLEEKLFAIADLFSCRAKKSGAYPPWEFRPDSPMREVYLSVYREETKKEAKTEAIHAGLECGIFASSLEDLDCISIGPNIFDPHTTGERLSLSSADLVYRLVQKTLEKCR